MTDKFKFLAQASLIDTQDCIIWPYFCDKAGYGQIVFEGKTQYAHRLMMDLFGPSPATNEHRYVAHLPVICHNPSCINLKHLYWATPSENVRDKKKDGTRPLKVSDEDVEIMRKLYKEGRTIASLAMQFGIDTSSVGKIVKRRRRA